MGLLSIFKKKDSFDLPPLGKDPFVLPKDQPHDPFAAEEERPDFRTPLKHDTIHPMSNFSAQSPNRDTELILTKLDAIRSAISNVEMRLARLEKIADNEPKNYRW